MQDALGNRDVIGQAKGLLMERHGVTPDAAFGVLSRVSQAENMKLAEIARRLVDTGKLPACRAQIRESTALDSGRTVPRSQTIQTGPSSRTPRPPDCTSRLGSAPTAPAAGSAVITAAGAMP
jgi:hypothetical protein